MTKYIKREGESTNKSEVVAVVLAPFESSAGADVTVMLVAVGVLTTTLQTMNRSAKSRQTLNNFRLCSSIQSMKTPHLYSHLY